MKKLLVFIAGLVAVVLFSGCAQREGEVSNFAKNYYSNNKNVYLIGSGSDFVKNNWAFQLQEVSEFGLKHGWRYFAIVKPNRISNTKGGSFNTFEEINKFCSDNSFDCGKDSLIYWEVRYFKKQPVEFVTFDAKAVIRDLKQRNLFSHKPPKGSYSHRFRNKLSYDELRKLAPF